MEEHFNIFECGFSQTGVDKIATFNSNERNNAILSEI